MDRLCTSFSLHMTVDDVWINAGVAALSLFPVMKKEFFENVLEPNILLRRLAGI